MPTILLIEVPANQNAPYLDAPRGCRTPPPHGLQQMQTTALSTFCPRKVRHKEEGAARTFTGRIIKRRRRSYSSYPELTCRYVGTHVPRAHLHDKLSEP